MLAQADLDALWDFDDAAGSEQRLRDAASTAHGPDRAELQTQVARALGLRARYADAERVLDGIAPEVPVVFVRILLERGRLRNSAGEPESAIALFQEAAESALAEGLIFLAIDALHMLAIADSDRADAWTADALRMLEAVTDPRTLRWRVSLHNNTGWRRFDAGRLDEALHEFTQARTAAIEWGTAQQVEWADEAIAECRAAQV